MFNSLFPSGGQSKVTYIVKSSGGAQGKGIFLMRRLEDVKNLGTVCIAHPYITVPLLIDGRAFDLRIYILVKSCSPLCIYLFGTAWCECVWRGMSRVSPGYHARSVHAPDELCSQQAQRQVPVRRSCIVDCRGLGLQVQHPVVPLLGASEEGVGHHVQPVVKDWGHFCPDECKHPSPPPEGVFDHIHHKPSDGLHQT